MNSHIIHYNKLNVVVGNKTAVSGTCHKKRVLDHIPNSQYIACLCF